MKINNGKGIELTYHIICEAINGNDKAEKLILDYYEPYIIKLSKIPYINDDGQINYVIDEDLYITLKLKLHELILKFVIV